MRKPKTQRTMLEFLRSPGVTEYHYKGKAERAVAERLAEKGIVIHEDLGFASVGRFNRKFTVKGKVSLA